MSAGSMTRLLASGEVGSLLPLIRLARRDAPAAVHLLDPEFPAIEAHLQTWMEQSGAAVVICELQDTPVGFILARQVEPNIFSDRGYMEIEALYVKRPHRRHGIGKAMILHVGELALDAEADYIITTALTGDRSELRFLAGLGFGHLGSRRICETQTLIRRLEIPSNARERRIRSLDELIARRRRARGLPPTPPLGINLRQAQKNSSDEPSTPASDYHL